ncbi:MAG: hypothetical protein IPM69_13550 [Ignavibacteria bacterium]|nr:hypothetical protein [Ignavibacteria bacterium]
MKNQYSFLKRMIFAAFVCLFSIGSVSAQWTKLDAPTPITTYNSLHTQVYLDGVLYMFGGAPGLSQATTGAWSLDTKTLNPQWKAIASMPVARVSAYAAAVNGKIYIIGGFYISGNARITTPEVLEYDPTANSYTVKSTMPLATYGMAGAVVANKIYVMSGIANNNYTNSTQVYDVAADTWANSTASTLSSIYPTASAIGNDIYLLGGQSTSYFNTFLKGTVNGATITWKKMTNVPVAISGAASGIADGNLFVAGGSNADGVLASTYKYNVTANKWSSSFTMPIATYYTGNMVGDGTSLYFIHGADSPETYKFVDGAPVAIIGTAPAAIEYKLKSGTTGTKSIFISNLGTLPLNVVLTSPSTDKWLTSDAGEFTVEAGQRFEVNMIANSTGMTEGVYTSTITIASDDVKNPKISIPVKMTLVDVTAKRLPLLEVFTSSTCGPCKPGNERLDAVIKPIDRSNYTVLKFQQDFPGTGDPYATNETINRRNFYNINSIPRMEVDGGWDQNASSFTNQVMNDATSQICLLNWEASYAVVGNKVSVTATLDPLADYSEQNMKIYVAILEKRTVKNIKSNGETVFEDVVKKMLPDENGTPLAPMTKGTKVTKTFEYTFPGKYRLPSDGQSANRIKLASENSVEDIANLEVIVWAQNTATKEVYNAGWASSGPAAKKPVIGEIYR